jgi:phosphatidylserine/phosphatidylglycerophosphate/cardiolipin synthase-like enzyme
MSNGLGTIESIAASGSWSRGYVGDIRDMFFNTLNEAESDVKITTFSLGRDNDEVNEFFSILENLLKNQRNVKIIVNDDGRKDGTCSLHAKKKITYLAKNYPEKFFYQYFNSTKTKILHAKLTIVDNKIALVGSANISKNALVSNYEIMLKVGKPAAATLSLMFDKLSKDIEGEQ